MIDQAPQPEPGSLPVLLVLTSTYPRWHGDPEPGFVHELAKRLTGRFQVIVLGPHAAGVKAREAFEGVEVVRYRYAPERWETLVNDGGIVTNLRRHRWKVLLVPGFVLLQGWHAWRLCRARKVDVIHAHWLLPQGLIAVILQAMCRRRIPFLCTSHGADLYALRGRWVDRLKRTVVSRSAASTVVSRSMLGTLSGIGGNAEKLSVQPMGVDLSGRFVPSDQRERADSEILFVGRLVEKKGLRHLVAAMPTVLSKVPGARLTIVGFGPEEPALRKQVSKLGLEGQVEFHGAIPQERLPDYYRRATLFVAPFVEAQDGDREGLGLVTVEAVACGCPVIIGAVPAVFDVVDPAMDSAMLVPPGDEPALAQTIVQCLLAPDEARRAADCLRTRVAARFDWDNVAGRYGDLLAEVKATGA